MEPYILPGSKIPNLAQACAELRALDDEIYGKLPAKDNPASDRWIEVAEAYPDQEIIIFDSEGRARGNLHPVPVTRVQVDAIMAGEFDDGMLTAASVHEAMQDAAPAMHIVSFIISPELRGKGYAKRMWEVQCEFLMPTSQMLAVAWSPDAQRFLVPLRWHGPLAWDAEGHATYRLPCPGNRVPLWP